MADAWLAAHEAARVLANEVAQLVQARPSGAGGDSGTEGGREPSAC